MYDEGDPRLYDPTHLQWEVNRVADKRNARKLANLLHRYQPRSSLDIACGTGRDMQSLQTVAMSVGVDLSGEFLDLAGGEKRIPGRYVQGDAERLPFQSGSFDLVLLNAALHHVDDVDATMTEACRVLAPGGILIILGEPNAIYTRWSNPFFLLTMVGARLTAPHVYRLIRSQMLERGPCNVCMEEDGHSVDPHRVLQSCHRSGVSDVSLFSYDFFPRLFARLPFYPKLYGVLLALEHSFLRRLFPRLIGSVFGYVGRKPSIGSNG